MVIQIISFVLLSVGALVIFVDLIPVVKDWFGRIYIGRYIDKNTWNQSITNIGIRWLNKTPKIKVTDNTRLIIIDILKGNYTKNAIQHWQEASLLLGISEYLNNTDDIEIKSKVVKYLNAKFDRDGGWLDKPVYVDGAILAYAVMKLNFIDTDKYKKALDDTWEMIRDYIGEDSTVEYRKFMKSYRYVDTIGFICPFLVYYGTRYQRDECIDLAIKQIKQYERFGMLKEHFIPSHTYKLEKKVPVGLYGWGRGLGWFAIGLIDAWNELPPYHRYKPMLEEIIKQFARSAISFQQVSGNWNWTVTRGECRPDSSTTATLSWFMLNAAKINEISKECIESAEKAVHYLMKVTRRNGAVDFSQGDTKDIGVYSTSFNILPFTQGFCIRCINLYLRKNKVAGQD